MSFLTMLRSKAMVLSENASNAIDDAALIGDREIWIDRQSQQASHHDSANSSPEAAHELWLTWHHRAQAAWQLAKNPPKLDAWNCIHSYEGSWSDPDAPYWGGLQMDMNFQSAYGTWLLNHKGTANHWTPLQQIWAGVRAWRVRGFAPWSNTAHACGVY